MRFCVSRSAGGREGRTEGASTVHSGDQGRRRRRRRSALSRSAAEDFNGSKGRSSSSFGGGLHFTLALSTASLDFNGGMRTAEMERGQLVAKPPRQISPLLPLSDSPSHFRADQLVSMERGEE